MRVVGKRLRPMSLLELHDGIRRRALPPRAVAVTFDDGYAAHLDEMTSAAKRMDVPITSFVCTGPVANGREFWWDELSRLLLESATLPDTLRMTVAGKEIIRQLGDDAVCSAEQVARYARWRVWDPPPGARAQLYNELYQLLFPLGAADRATALDALMQWSAGTKEPRESHRVVSPSELRELAGLAGIEIGAHTITHSPLAQLPREEQRREIIESKHTIETITGRRVTTFAYPFGRRSDYDDSTVDLVRGAGFTCACANVPGPAHDGSPVYELPRVQIQNWSPEQLSQRLNEWLTA